MRYNDALTKYNIKKQKRTQRITLITKKLTQQGKQIPQEIKDELEFTKL
jgi:GTP-dependent phosphoenolpyruvate carboxykinase